MVELLMIFSGILVSLYSVYTDIKYGLIRNKAIFFLIPVAVFGHTYLYIIGIEQLSTILLIVSEALIFGFILYYFGLLSSGDTKLFWSLSFVLPVSFYVNANKTLPIESMLFNIFIPVLIFLVVYILYKTPLQTKIKTLGHTLNLKFLINHFVGFFALVGSSIMALQYFNIPVNFLFTILLVLVLLEFIKKLPINNWFVYLALLIFTLFNLGNLMNFLLLAFVVLFVRTGLEYFVLLSKSVFLKEVRIDKLVPSLSPAEAIIYNGRKYFKKSVNYSGISPVSFGKYKKIIIDPSFESISQEEIDELKKLSAQGKLDFNTLVVNETIPFAPFIFFGFLLTILFKGSFIYYLILII